VKVASYEQQQVRPGRITSFDTANSENTDERFGDATDGEEMHASQPAAIALTLDNVLDSVYNSYPLLRIAVEQRSIAEGQILEAQGEFDLKLKGGGNSGPLGFYQTNRFGTGFEQAMFGGGEMFAGYRIGRGNFQPWYGERETNDGGEFKAGFLIPLLQNRRIDDRRATIFRSVLGRDAVEPDILLQLIDFVRSASYTYWDWVAAGQVIEIEQSLLDIALQRQQGLQQRVDGGDLPRIELTDNERLIASRRAAVIESQRKFQQSTIKLSLFFRTPDGQPDLAPSSRLPGKFPEAKAYDSQQLAADIQIAIVSRPETQYLDFIREQMEVDLAQARNLYLPDLRVGATASQDVGAAASSKGDKTPFELEASLLASMPLQRRKALGKLQATQSKLVQIQNKTQFAREKISTDVQNAVAALQAAHQRISQAQQSVELNRTMQDAERKRFDEGDSNLLIVNLREQATADARKTLVAAQLEYFLAEADYRAALATIPIPEPEP
jgi:outer membrane protein TolC